MLRTKRLQTLRKHRYAEEQLRLQQLKLTKDPQYATLIGEFGEFCNILLFGNFMKKLSSRYLVMLLSC